MLLAWFQISMLLFTDQTLSDTRLPTRGCLVLHMFNIHCKIIIQKHTFHEKKKMFCLWDSNLSSCQEFAVLLLITLAILVASIPLATSP